MKSILLCVFLTKSSQLQVVDSLSKKLNSLEDMMKVLIIGDDNDIQLLADRLIKLNEQVSASNYTGSKRQYLSEVYNLCYTIKVLIRYEEHIRTKIISLTLHFVAMSLAYKYQSMISFFRRSPQKILRFPRFPSASFSKIVKIRQLNQ